MTEPRSGATGVVVRRYAALSHEAALDVYERDLEVMVAAGYYPVGQSWGPATPGSPAAGWPVPGGGTLAVTFRYDPWAVAERGLETPGATNPERGR